MKAMNEVSQDWLQYCATREQLDTFNDNGYLVVEEALTPQIIDRLTEAVNRVEEERKRQKLSTNTILNKFRMVVEDDMFLELC